MPQKITISNNDVLIREFNVNSPDFAQYLQTFPEEEYEDVTKKVIEVGAYCLMRVSQKKDIDFVEKMMTESVSKVENALEEVIGEVEKRFISAVSGEESEIRTKLLELVRNAGAVAHEKISEVKELYREQIDPNQPHSSISLIKSKLEEVKGLLDPSRIDSVPQTIKKAIADVSGENGAMALSITNLLNKSLLPIKEEIERMSRQIFADEVGKEMVDEALSHTTVKGDSFEETCTDLLQKWSKFSGAEVNHVGDDKKPGDIIVTVPVIGFTEKPYSVVIEAKDDERQVGRKAISKDITQKIQERSADAGIYVKKNSEQFAREVGDWAEGTTAFGPFIATTKENMITAVRFLITQFQITQIKNRQSKVDVTVIVEQIQRIRDALRSITSINSNLTKINNAGDSIRQDVSTLREDIESSIREIERACAEVSSEDSAA